MTAALVPVVSSAALDIATIRRPETPAEVAAAFLAGYSSRDTRTAYARDLGAWSAWLASAGVEPWEAERVHVDVFARSMEAAGASVATVARRLSALAGFYEYAASVGQVAVSPLAHVKRPRLSDESQTLGLDRAQLVQLLAVAKADGARTYALVCLLGLNGLRISEALGANTDDLAEIDGHRTLKLRRKGGREQYAALPPAVWAALSAWLPERDEIATRDDGARPLFVTRSGRRLDRQAAWKVVKRCARDAGLPDGISPHSLRHAFVTLALKAGAPLHLVQDAAGHADPRTTRRYDRQRHALDGHAAYQLATFMAA
jgi:integrase/recombinase XerD